MQAGRAGRGAVRQGAGVRRGTRRFGVQLPPRAPLQQSVHDDCEDHRGDHREQQHSEAAERASQWTYGDASFPGHWSASRGAGSRLAQCGHGFSSAVCDWTASPLQETPCVSPVGGRTNKRQGAASPASSACGRLAAAARQSVRNGLLRGSRSMSEAKSSQATSSRARSPFPPIAEYAFLSDCHTGALLAADGSVDWLCVPRFDAPSVFGNLLDRGAGSFRFGPYGVNVPTDRVYNPGTNVVATAWHSGDGWLLVQEALILGPRTRQDRVTPHTRPPMDDDAAHMLVRVVECLDGEAEFELVCEPMFDYGRTVAQWTVVDDEGHVAEVSGADLTLRLASDMAMGVEGGTARARHTLRKGERAFCALSWAEDLTVPADADEAYALIRQTVTFWRSWLARARIP